MSQQPGSIKSRIAALNIEQVHVPAPGSRPTYIYEQAIVANNKPPLPPPGRRPPPQQRQQTVNNPPILSNAATSTRHLGNQPASVIADAPKIAPEPPPRPPPRTGPPPLPPRKSPNRTPVLPPRTASEHSARRRDSLESVNTVSSGISYLSLPSVETVGSNGTTDCGQLRQVRAPPYDPSKLPPLPPKQAPEDPKQSKATLKAMKSSIGVVPHRSLPPQLNGNRPPPPPRPTRATAKVEEDVQAETCQILPPPRRSALDFGINKSTEAPPPIPTNRPSLTTSTTSSTEPGAPPPVPFASRPNLDVIMASKPKPGATAGCLKCRNFSGPDHHAAQFPRSALPSSDVGWLAHQLTVPFASPTDKARALFVWLHHNIDYDTHSFFSGTVSPSTPERTITTGLAVCEGYAGLFAALALKAGLESIVISGHGKGYGHSALKPGDPTPPFSCGHAWNAVKIDNGEWKLIDACWGAGALGCGNKYSRHFTASEFTKDNIEFGYTHFPADKAHFFRADGRIPTWEEYMMDDMGERVQIWGDPGDHGIGKRTFQPAMKHIKLHDPQDSSVVRFQFATVCPHWDHERNGKGKPYLFTLNIGGRDGRNSQHLPFNTDGKVWWLDVDRSELGCMGQKVSLNAVTDFDGRDGRGLTISQYKAKIGRCALKWQGVAMWEVV